MNKALGLILAGGKGERLGLLCYKRAKPVLPYAGNYRVIDFSLSNCINSHLSTVAVITDYQRHSVARYLDNSLLLRQQYGVNLHILSPKRGSYRGTADAVYQNLGYVREQDPDLVIILAGDHVYKMDYRPFLAYHKKKRADVTVAVTSVPIEQAHQFGIVAVDGQGEIVNFKEKPRLPRSNLVSMGIYVFSIDVLLDCLKEDAYNPLSRHDFGYCIVPAMLGKKKVFAYEYTDYWRDIGTVEGYYQASMDLLHDEPPFSLDGQWPVLVTDELSAPKVLSAGVLDNSLAGQGCIIRGRVWNSVLSQNVVVAEGALVKDSLVLPDCFIGKHSVIDRCILDERVNISAGSYIGYGPGSLLGGSQDLTLIGAGVAVPPNTFVGRNCIILPGTEQTQFKAPMIASGSTLSPA